MALRVIIDDVAALSATASSRSTINRDVVVSTLRDAADLEALTANGLADTGDVPMAIVTADARLGSVATGARRVVDVGLLPSLVDDPDAEFQYCAFWATPNRLAAVSSALQAQGVIPLHRSPGGDTFRAARVVPAPTFASPPFPPNGPAGQPIALNGTNFGWTPKVRFEGAASDSAVVGTPTDTQIVVMVPTGLAQPGQPRDVHITVTTAGGSITSGEVFRIIAAQ